MKYSRRRFFGLLPLAGAAAVAAPAVAHGVWAAEGRIMTPPFKMMWPDVHVGNHQADMLRYVQEMVKHNEMLSTLTFDDFLGDALIYNRDDKHAYLEGYTG